MSRSAASTSRRKTRLQLAKEVRDAVRKYVPDLPRDYDPVVELAIAGANPRIDPSMRVMANREVAGYLYHKLKAVDLTVANKGPVTVVAMDFNSLGQNMNPLQLIEAQQQVKELVEEDDDDDETDEN